MSKITFRADEGLIQRLEEFDASKSEVMREALREFLGEPSADLGRQEEHEAPEEVPGQGDQESLDALVADRVDAIVADRVDALVADHIEALVADRVESGVRARPPQDVNVNITLDGDSGGGDAHSGSATVERETERKTTAPSGENDPDEEGKTCKRCGDTLSPGAVYCPNCGEKASHRVFCECGDELRSDWAFCPSCGRRTPAADVLDGP